MTARQKITFKAVSMLLISSFSFASPKVLGLICDQNLDGQNLKNQIFISTSKATAYLSVKDASEDAQKVQIAVSLNEVSALLKDNLAQMSRKILLDKKSGARIEFLVDGTEFNGKSRLSALISDKGFKFKLSNCTVKFGLNASH